MGNKYYCRNCNLFLNKKDISEADSSHPTGLTHNKETCYGVVEIVQQNEKDLVGFDVEELDNEDLIEEVKLMGLQVYIAASIKDREIAKLLETSLSLIHIQNTASWVGETVIQDPLSDPNNCRYWANMDMNDIDKSQVIIFLAGNGPENTLKKEFKTTGKNIEFGYALAMGKPILFIGKPYSVFHHHESVTFFDNTDDLISWFKSGIGGSTNAVRLAALL